MGTRRFALFAKILGLCLLMLVCFGGRNEVFAATYTGEIDINADYSNTTYEGSVNAAPSITPVTIHGNRIYTGSWTVTGSSDPYTYTITWDGGEELTNNANTSGVSAYKVVDSILDGGNVSGNTYDIPANLVVENGGSFSSTNESVLIRKSLTIEAGAIVSADTLTYNVSEAINVHEEVAAVGGGKVSFNNFASSPNTITVVGDHTDENFKTNGGAGGSVEIKNAGLVDSSVTAVGSPGINKVISTDATYVNTTIEVVGDGSGIAMSDGTSIRGGHMEARAADAATGTASITITGTPGAAGANPDVIWGASGGERATFEVEGLASHITMSGMEDISSATMNATGANSYISISGPGSAWNSTDSEQVVVPLDIANTDMTATGTGAYVKLEDINSLSAVDIKATGAADAKDGGGVTVKFSTTDATSKDRTIANSTIEADGLVSIQNVTSFTTGSVTSNNGSVDIDGYGTATSMSGVTIKALGEGADITIDGVTTISGSNMEAKDEVIVSGTDLVVGNAVDPLVDPMQIEADNKVSIGTVAKLTNTKIATINAKSDVILTGNGKPGVNFGMEKVFVDAKGGENTIQMDNFGRVADATLHAGDAVDGVKSDIIITGTGIRASNYTDLEAESLGIGSTVSIEKVGSVANSKISTVGLGGVITVKGDVTNVNDVKVDAQYNDTEILASGANSTINISDGLTMTDVQVKATGGAGTININDTNNKEGPVTFAGDSSIEDEGPGAVVNVKDNTIFDGGSHIYTWNSGAVADGNSYSNLVKIDGADKNATGAGVKFSDGSYIHTEGGAYGGNTEIDIKNQVSFDKSSIRADDGHNKIQLSALKDGDVAFSNKSYIDAEGGDTRLQLAGDGLDNGLKVAFDDSNATVRGSNNEVEFKENVLFDNESSLAVGESTTDTNQQIRMHDNVTFEDSTALIKGAETKVDLYDGVAFTGTAGATENTSRFEVEGDNAEITTGKDVTFTDATLGLKGTGGLVEIRDNGDFAGQSLIYIDGKGDGENFNKLYIHGDPNKSPNGVTIQDSTEIRINGGKNIMLVEGTTTIENQAVANVNGSGNKVTFDEDVTVKDGANININNDGNTVLMTGDTRYQDSAKLNIKGVDNSVTITGQTKFVANASTNVDGDGNTKLVVSGSASYEDKAKYNLNGKSNELLVSGDATFGKNSLGGAMPDDYAGITATGNNNTIRLTENAKFLGNSTVYSTGGDTNLYILDNVQFEDNSNVQLLASNENDGVGGNLLVARLTDDEHRKDGPYLETWNRDTGKFEYFNDITGKWEEREFSERDEMLDDSKVTYKTKTIFSGSGNEAVFGGNTWVDKTSDITFLQNSNDDGNANTDGIKDGHSNTVVFTEYSRYTGNMTMDGRSNNLQITGRTMYQGWTKMTGDDNYVLINMDPDLVSLRSDTYHSPDYYNITGQVVFDEAGTSTTKNQNKVRIENGQLTNLKGSVVGSDIYETDVLITGGQTNLLVSGAAGSHYEVNIANVKMNDAVSTATRYDRFRDYGTLGGVSETDIYEGNIYNIRAKDGTYATRTDKFKDDYDFTGSYLDRDQVQDASGVALNNSIHYIGNKDEDGNAKVYQSYSILNMGEVELRNGAVLHIGEVKGGDERYAMKNEPNGTSPTDYDRNLKRLGLGNQLSTDSLAVTGESKIMIHEDKDRIGKKLTDTTWDFSSRNVVNTTYIETGSEMTIDRTTIFGNNNDTGYATITVGSRAVLYGFGEWSDKDKGHDPLRANLVGDLWLESNSLLQPFDADFYSHKDSGGYTDSLRSQHIFDTYNGTASQREQLRGVVFQVTSTDGTAGGKGGTTHFASQSTFRTRLFADDSSLKANVSESTGSNSRGTQYADYIKSTGSDFSDIVSVNNNPGNSQVVRDENKVQYQPVFGYHSDLASKLKFNIFDCDTQEQSYYFKFIDGDREIKELVGYNDANHLINNRILVSDMLGAWSFLKSADNQDITLRFRLLAEHPMNGGLGANVLDKNNMQMARYLDEIRYPFWTEYTDLAFEKDPSYSAAYFSGSLDPATPGYGGDMAAWYAANKLKGSGDVQFDNYTEGYIKDWENFFLGLQEELACATRIDDILNQLQPEVYGTVSDTNFDIMSAFIRNRERNSPPNRWRAPSSFADYCNRCPRQSVCPHKSVDPGKFQFWASAFGADGKYERRGGSNTGVYSRNSYGYDTQLWGGAVGVVRDWERSYMGVTIGYGKQTNKWDGIPVRTETKAHIVEALYGRRFGADKRAFVEVYGDFSYNDQDVRRSIRAGSYNANMSAKFHDIVIGGGVRAGYNADLGCGWQFMPTVAVNVYHNRTSTIGEEPSVAGANGSATALVIDKNSANRTAVRIPIMAKVSKVFRPNECTEIVPEIHAGVIAHAGSTNGKVTAKFAGNPVDNRYFSTESEGKGSYEAIVGGSLEVGRRDQYYLSGAYDFTTSPNSKDHSFSVATGVNF